MTVFVLSINGGGIRGALSSRFLENLEKNMKLSLYDKFQVFTGTSTGAFIISSIAYKKMTAAKISTELYTLEMSNKMMSKSLWDRMFGCFQFQSVYDGKGKTELLHDIYGDETIQNTYKKVLIPIYDVTDETPKFIRSWRPDIEPNYILSNILDATSAAPPYYPSVEYIPGKKAIDGWFACYNPSIAAYISILEEYPGEDDIRVLSIGTGRGMGPEVNKRSSNWDGFQWVGTGGMIDVLYDSQVDTNDYLMKSLTRSNGHKYLHVDISIENSEMDDTTENNIFYMRSMGDDMWKKWKTEVLALLNI
jgi:patatin-like phospholipase/acyl hydrolase